METQVGRGEKPDCDAAVLYRCSPAGIVEVSTCPGVWDASCLERVDGIEQADNAGKSLSEISDLSLKVSTMISQLAAASSEQSSAVEDISKNLEAIAGVSRATADGARETVKAAEQLNQQSETIRQMVNQFKV